MYLFRKPILNLGAYAPGTRENISKCQKNLNKFLARICRHYMYARQVSQKIDIFVSSAKKIKKCLVKSFF
jgi:hypothetical protein